MGRDIQSEILETLESIDKKLGILINQSNASKNNQYDNRQWGHNLYLSQVNCNHINVKPDGSGTSNLICCDCGKHITLGVIG